MKYLDMLAKLGVGSAHPGGFTATLELLHSRPIAAGSRILEVGYGTGRTACYLAKQQFKVTAIDLRADMLEKAAYRAKLEEVDVDFVEANVEQLPFADHSFDVVIAESVTIFANSVRAIEEYYRVLAPGGVLYDRELMLVKTLPPDIHEKVLRYYDVSQLWSSQQWQQELIQAGFRNVDLLQPGTFDVIDWEDELQHPDEGGVADPAVYFDERVWQLTREYDEIMLNYGDHFGFGVWCGIK